MNRMNAFRLVTVLLVIAFVPGEFSSAVAAGNPEGIRRDAVVDAVEKAMPSVVNIATETIVRRNNPMDDFLSDFFGYRQMPRNYKSYSVGSGVIIDEDGYVLTNFHVIEGASRVQVKLHDGREFDADKINYGSSRSDVALLHIIAPEGTKFQAVRFAKDDDLLLGETVLALGNPFGLGGSVSRGILSSKSRRPINDDEQLGIADWLQTDAAINPGNSGGALINLNGELIGMNVAVFRGNNYNAPAQGIGFAIPIKRVREAISYFFVPETTQGLWFGARINPGVFPLVVADVQKDSPADKGGLRVGDQVVEVNGKIPDSFIEFNELVGKSNDHTANVEVSRGGKRIRTTIDMMKNADFLRARLGASLQELTPELARMFDVGTLDGLLVAGVEEDGPLDKVGITKGDLIAAIQGSPMHDLARATLALSEIGPGDDVVLRVIARRQRGAFTRLQQGDVRIKLK
ncbi:PDZ domain-containing protein [bacterium]|nr:PDZ domain-containing protein [bacterium]